MPMERKFKEPMLVDMPYRSTHKMGNVEIMRYMVPYR